MSAQKFEQLIDLIINEDEAKAKQLFHDIIVEASREIYEKLINEDQSMGFQEEIDAEGTGQAGMMEDEEFEDDEIIGGDFDTEDDGSEEEFGGEEEDEEFGSEEDEEEFGPAEEDTDEDDLEDRVVDLEDKLDELMAEFEAQLGGDEEEFDGEEEGEEVEDELMENVSLKQVGGKQYNQFAKGGDDGQQTKSPVTANSGQRGMASSPVKFAGDTETMPTSPKKPSNAYAKGEGKLVGDVGNTPGKDNFKERGEAAPKPKTETVKAKSPVAESKTAKRRI